MKGLMKEFKEFISKGNVMSMAVGIIIGGAFTGIVNSLVNDIINPIIGLFGGMNFDQFAVRLNDEAVLAYGNFLSNVINFVIMAFVVFMMVKGVNKLTSKIEKKEEPAAPTTKDCPYCKTKIALAATRCPNCTSMLEEQ